MMTDEEYKRHIQMQNKIFPDWVKYWIFTKEGQYIRKTKTMKAITNTREQ